MSLESPSVKAREKDAITPDCRFKRAHASFRSKPPDKASTRTTLGWATQDAYKSSMSGNVSLSMINSFEASVCNSACKAFNKISSAWPLSNERVYFRFDNRDQAALTYSFCNFKLLLDHALDAFLVRLHDSTPHLRARNPK